MRRALVGCAVAFASVVACSSFGGEEPASTDAGGGDGGVRNDAGAVLPDANARDATSDNDARSADDPCPAGTTTLGRFITYLGKVNVHSPTVSGLDTNPYLQLNGWAADADCRSGADKDDINYCRHFWSTTSSVSGPFTPDPANKIFATELCASVDESPGQNLYSCCGP